MRKVTPHKDRQQTISPAYNRNSYKGPQSHDCCEADRGPSHENPNFAKPDSTLRLLYVGVCYLTKRHGFSNHEYHTLYWTLFDLP